MSYESISINEVIKKINNSLNGWYLPYVQRPYVWGSRYENEKYICKLFDSLLRGYPIGTLIVWNTHKEVPYKEFITDYTPDIIPNIVEKGKWSRKDKWLVYDGQQRLQTLHSCLNYTFNKKILVYDLLFDLDKKEIDADDTGFKFVEKNADLENQFIRMNELFIQVPNDEFDYTDAVINRLDNVNDSELKIAKKNVRNLWKIFNDRDKKSIAYFPIVHSEESKVNDIFQRLNTGGVPLSLADILFSKIKEKGFNFEEELQFCSKRIYNNTGKGYQFSSYSILQLMNLMIKNTLRVDPDKVSDTELIKFTKLWKDIENPIQQFFESFIWGQFKINNSSIIPKKLALLPLLIYIYELDKKNVKFRNITADNILLMKKYFIYSQLNDWNIQSIIDNFSRIIKEISSKSTSQFMFPFQEFINWLSKTKKRNTVIYRKSFEDYLWFGLKIVTPDCIYQFDPDQRGRFNPEIDHIFPKGLKDQSDEYKSKVDIIWNMQPVKGEINNFKRRRHPKEYFLSSEGSKYIGDYAFLPTKDLNNYIWDNPLDFISRRKEMIIDYINNEYDITIIE